MLHPVLPAIEIGLSKNTVVLLIYPHGHIVPYKINPKEEFFVINESRAFGLYFINDKYRFMWEGKTPVYFYAVGNFTPIDPTKLDRLNGWKKSNRLAQVREKDIRHGAMIRHLGTQIDKREIFDKMREEMQTEDEKIVKAINDTLAGIEGQIEKNKRLHGQTIIRTPKQRAIIIINYLTDLKLITKDEQNTLLLKIDSGKLSFENLINELRYRQIVSVAEELPEDLEDFLNDLKQQNENNLADFIDDTVASKQGFRKYKQTLVKQWFSSLLIGGSILVATSMPWILALIGVIHLPDPRYAAIGMIVFIIAMGRYHFPMGIAPIALVFYPNATITPYPIKRSSHIFVLDTPVFKNVYSMTNKLRLVWNGKIATYLYVAENSELTRTILEETEVLVKPKFGSKKK